MSVSLPLCSKDISYFSKVSILSRHVYQLCSKVCSNTSQMSDKSLDGVAASVSKVCSNTSKNRAEPSAMSRCFLFRKSAQILRNRTSTQVCLFASVQSPSNISKISSWSHHVCPSLRGVLLKIFQNCMSTDTYLSASAEDLIYLKAEHIALCLFLSAPGSAQNLSKSSKFGSMSVRLCSTAPNPIFRHHVCLRFLSLPVLEILLKSFEIAAKRADVCLPLPRTSHIQKSYSSSPCLFLYSMICSKYFKTLQREFDVCLPLLWTLRHFKKHSRQAMFNVCSPLLWTSRSFPKYLENKPMFASLLQDLHKYLKYSPSLTCQLASGLRKLQSSFQSFLCLLLSVPPSSQNSSNFRSKDRMSAYLCSGLRGFKMQLKKSTCLFLSVPLFYQNKSLRGTCLHLCSAL
jgi:hypothetical protein